MQIKFSNGMNQLKMGNAKIGGIGNTDTKGKTNGINLNNRTQTAAATVDFTKSGRYKARLLKESEQSKQSDVMQQAESTINDIIDTVKSGGKLTKEQERIFDEGMKDLASKHYKDMKDMKLSASDILEELKENYLQRQQLFADLQEKVESEMTQGRDLSDNVKLMTAQQEHDEKKKLIEILKESIMDDSDDPDADPDSDQKVSDDSSQDSIDVATDEQDQNEDSTDTVDAGEIRDKRRAADLIDKNSKQISDMKAQSANERAQELQYAKYLDRDYEQIMELLDQDDVSNEEKVQAYEDYKQNSHANAHNREVHRIKKEFDHETWMVAKIQFQSHSAIHNVVAEGPDLSQIGTDFIRKFLI